MFSSARVGGIHTPVGAKAPYGVARYVPIIRWLPSYQAKFLSGDEIPAVTVWALLVPEKAMGYAVIARGAGAVGALRGSTGGAGLHVDATSAARSALTAPAPDRN